MINKKFSLLLLVTKVLHTSVVKKAKKLLRIKPINILLYSYYKPIQASLHQKLTPKEPC